MLYILILLSVIYCRYTTHLVCISSNLEGSKKLPDDGRLVPKHVGASIHNKAIVHISVYCWSILLRLIMHGTNIKLPYGVLCNICKAMFHLAHMVTPLHCIR
jgi:hypothetical protein